MYKKRYKKVILIIAVLFISICFFSSTKASAEGNSFQSTNRLSFSNTYLINLDSTQSSIGTSSSGYDVTGNLITLNETNANYVFSSTSDSLYTIKVNANCTITLNGVILSGNTLSSPIDLNGKNVTVNISNDSSLYSTGKAGIQVDPSATLTIEGSAKLTVKGGNNCAGIGSDFSTDSGTIIINSGTIISTGGQNGAGIGGGRNHNSGPISITGGYVTAQSGINGAGIGGGTSGNSGPISITGGYVTAQSTDNGAGIGGGNSGNSGPINISGGIIKAMGEGDGAGIGAGAGGTAGTLTITGGTIYANSNFGDSSFGAGIGSGGSSGLPPTATITGGSVRCINVVPDNQYIVTDFSGSIYYQNVLSLQGVSGTKTITQVETNTGIIYSLANLKDMQTMTDGENEYISLWLQNSPQTVAVKANNQFYFNSYISTGKISPYEYHDTLVPGYSVTVNSQMGGSASLGSGVIPDYTNSTTGTTLFKSTNNTISAVAYPSTGYAFDKWIATGITLNSTDEHNSNLTISSMPSNDIVLTAQFITTQPITSSSTSSNNYSSSTSSNNYSSSTSSNNYGSSTSSNNYGSSTSSNNYGSFTSNNASKDTIIFGENVNNSHEFWYPNSSETNNGSLSNKTSTNSENEISPDSPNYNPVTGGEPDGINSLFVLLIFSTLGSIGTFIKNKK